MNTIKTLDAFEKKQFMPLELTPARAGIDKTVKNLLNHLKGLNVSIALCMKCVRKCGI